MACQTQDSGLSGVMELLSERGFEGLPEALTLVLNEAMRL